MIAAVAGLAGFVRVLPHALKISMAPKTARNSGDRMDGSKMTCIGRDKGDLAGANRRPISTTGKPTGKNTSGPGKDAKTNDNVTPLSEKNLTSVVVSIASANLVSVKPLRLEINHQAMNPQYGSCGASGSVQKYGWPQEGPEFSTSTGGRTLKWDYSGIRLTVTPTTSGQELVNNNMEASTGGPASSG
ncbi:hypothetical protein NDU88_005474 [Pleurodeles waltl]|uniref:Uncharacterized protein n=1 Tax=Pleurodeles waltl TaxID=8319 RepID=A0AAV7VMW3_PLEWA|nr:hypothetical protein NDU88_005474 [Pleurodeles waltl]